jgi:hypothetical protein
MRSVIQSQVHFDPVTASALARAKLINHLDAARPTTRRGGVSSSRLADGHGHPPVVLRQASRGTWAAGLRLALAHVSSAGRWVQRALTRMKGGPMDNKANDNRPASTSDRSTGDLVGLLSEQVSLPVRDELKRARLEMTRKGKQAGLGVGILGSNALLALYGAGC